jgi:ABC-type maltose transport system permease subunit
MRDLKYKKSMIVIVMMIMIVMMMRIMTMIMIMTIIDDDGGGYSNDAIYNLILVYQLHKKTIEMICISCHRQSIQHPADVNSRD